MTIDSRKAPVELISLFIILSPLEHVARVEQIGYVFLIGVLLLLFSKKLTLKRGSKLILVLFTFHLLACCVWSPASNAAASGFTKLVVYLFLILAVQFDYTEEDYSRLKKAFILQGWIMVAICLLFGNFQNNRLWISSSSSSADPNYLSTWFIFPLVYACDEIVNTNENKIWKLIVAIEMIAIYACVFLTASRSGFVTNILVVALYAIYSFRETIRKNPIKALLIIAVVAIACITVTNLIPDYLLQRLTSTHSMGSRGRVWRELLSAMNSNWFQSIIGFGDGATVFYNTQGAIYGMGGLVAHNTFMDVMFNNGLIGIGYFLTIIIKGILNRLREQKIEIVIGAVGMCMAIFTLSALTTRPVSFMLRLLLIDINVENSQIIG